MTNDELAALYQQYGHLVFRRCRAILGSEAAAADVLQEVFVRALRYEKSLDRTESRLGWLCRTSERCCFTYMRKNRREVSLDPETLEKIFRLEGPQARNDARAAVEVFLGRFDDKTKQVALLHYLEGLTQEEVAQELGWSRRTVGKKLKLLQQHADKVRTAFTPAKSEHAR